MSYIKYDKLKLGRKGQQELSFLMSGKEWEIGRKNQKMGRRN